MSEHTKASVKSFNRSYPVTLRSPVIPSLVDIHCHCLLGLDDGPETMAESLALCRGLRAEGISAVIATPHQLGCYEGANDSGTIRRAAALLNGELGKYEIPLKVFAGADVRVDERIPALLKADQVLTLADGGRFLLLELPHETILDLRPLLKELAAMSITPILSHPERNEYLMRHPQAADAWLRLNCHLQITAGSLLGDFGRACQQSAWRFLTSGMASLVATDAHDLDLRRPRLRDAYALVSERLGVRAAQGLCVKNPQRILGGQKILNPGPMI